MEQELEFWRLPTVMQKTGLSRAEVYRRIKSPVNPLPSPRNYATGGRASFWISREVQAWMMREVATSAEDILG